MVLASSRRQGQAVVDFFMAAGEANRWGQPAVSTLGTAGDGTVTARARELPGVSTGSATTVLGER
jgi:hypothetical protein